MARTTLVRQVTLQLLASTISKDRNKFPTARTLRLQNGRRVLLYAFAHLKGTVILTHVTPIHFSTDKLFLNQVN